MATSEVTPSSATAPVQPDPLPDCGELLVLDRTGDTRHIWDRNKREEVDAARAVFDSLRRKGYLIHTVGKNGDPDEVMSTFNPSAERLIARPPVVGG